MEGIELKDFISQSLIQIIDGVRVAQQHASDHKAKVVPQLQPGSGPSDALRTHPDSRPLQNIDFDVAVQASTKDQAEGQIGILIATLGIGVKGSEETETSAISRIKFSIPLELPTQGQ